jgi:hypothetical protein
VSYREYFLENFAGDLEYHPRRAALYLVLSVVGVVLWWSCPEGVKFTTVPLIGLLGSLAFCLKGIFLLRKSSEGIGLTCHDVSRIEAKAKLKESLPMPAQAAQMLQDFGTGGFLGWPLLDFGKDFNQAWAYPPYFQVFLGGGILFLLGWMIRRLTAPPMA